MITHCRKGPFPDKGACGSIQLMLAAALRFSVINPFTIEQNIRAGAEHPG
jgi:hypothetical protein